MSRVSSFASLCRPPSEVLMTLATARNRFAYLQAARDRLPVIWRPQRRGETHPSATRDSGCRIELVLGARRCCAVSDRSNTPLIPDEFGVPPQSSVAVGRSATQRAAKCSHLTPIVSYLTRRFCAFLVLDGASVRPPSKGMRSSPRAVASGAVTKLHREVCPKGLRENRCTRFPSLFS